MHVFCFWSTAARIEIIYVSWVFFIALDYKIQENKPSITLTYQPYDVHKRSGQK